MAACQAAFIACGLKRSVPLLGLGQFALFVGIAGMLEFVLLIVRCDFDGLLFERDGGVLSAAHELQASQGVEDAGVLAFGGFVTLFGNFFRQVEVARLDARIGGDAPRELVEQPGRHLCCHR